MGRFFIDRPVFAWVIALVIMLAGGMSIFTLPVAQFPPVAPPQVRVSATYPGASAKTVQDSVIQIIEQRMNGLDGLLYMSSSSDSSGSGQVRLTFDASVNPDVAQMQVQNKLQLAMPRLPQEVQRQGLSVNKSGESLLKTYAFVDTSGKLAASDITDYVGAVLVDSISRLPGVGEVSLYGSQHGMRIWLNPNNLMRYGLMPSDVVAAVKAQNAQISAGQLGGAPHEPGQRTNLGISVQDRLETPEEFERILLRTNTDGSLVRLRDVARVEVGNDSYSSFSRYNGLPSAGVAVRLTSGANALDTVIGVDRYLREVEPFFPEGLTLIDQYDSTLFVSISINDVVKTLFEAVGLVFLIMFLFLQNFRATLIPTIAVPVVLLGTFGVLAVFGYSINTLTMFGMVLAIGLLVDDAIVVVENVERIMHEEGLSPLEATRRTMDEISSALVGIAVVLSAVFVPMAFFGGSVGIIYRQFSVTIVSAMFLSVVVALVLTPALCATMLRPPRVNHDAQHGFFGWFNRLMERGTRSYQSGVARLTRRTGRVMCLYILLLGALLVQFRALPTGFLPDEDQGSVSVQIQLPTGATFEQTVAVLESVERYVLNDEAAAVSNIMGVVGWSFAGSGQNMAMMTVRLKPWDERTAPELKADKVAKRISAFASTLRNARIFASIPPPVPQMGTSNGFDVQLQDRAGHGHAALLAARDELLRRARQSPVLSNVRASSQDDRPQLRVIIDREKAGAHGLSLAEINAALSTIWGSTYADDYLENGRIKKVYVQGDSPYRMSPEDMERWHFRNDKGQMVPFTAFATTRWEFAPTRLQRYNGLPSEELLGVPAEGHSTGEAMLEIERLVSELPNGFGYEWTGLSYQERLSGSQAPLLFALSALVVFLALSALYESWSVPLAVILVVPLGIFGALGAAGLRGMVNDVYLQVGLLTTMGLAAKNAILIVEFAKSLHDGGMELLAATEEACRLRLRPILMTSFAFLLGVLPLAISSGAGSGGQNAIGTAIMGGTFMATALGIFGVPVFFVMVIRVFTFFKTGGLLALVRRGSGRGTGAALLLILLGLGGCTLAPTYERPPLPVEEAWPALALPDGGVAPVEVDPRNAGESVVAADTSWQAFFSDPGLQAFIAFALENNRDLRLALLNVDKARATWGIQEAALFPELNASGQNLNQSQPASIASRGVRTQTRQSTLSVGLSAYELDFFGRVRSLEAQALERYLATEEALRSTRTTLVAAVATAWLTLAADRDSLALSVDTLAAQEAAYGIIKKRFEAGIASELDLWQAQTTVETARVSVARYTEQVAQDRAALVLLAGAPFPPSMLPARGLGDLPPWQPLTAELPSAVLLRRPDIMQAEHELMAANANIGAARANFFPRISLSTSLGTASPALDGLFEASSGLWAFTPQVSLPLFDWGSRRAALVVAETDRDMAVARYEKAIQTAFREVSSALIRRTAMERQLSAQESLTRAASESYRLSRLRYERGVDSYLAVLDSQRLLFSSQLTLVSLRAQREANIIELYRALGGGWR